MGPRPIESVSLACMQGAEERECLTGDEGCRICSQTGRNLGRKEGKRGVREQKGQEIHLLRVG